MSKKLEKNLLHFKKFRILAKNLEYYAYRYSWKYWLW